MGVSAYDLDEHGKPKDPDPRWDRIHEHDKECEPDCDLDTWNDEYGNDTGEEMQGRVQRAERNRRTGEDRPSETAHLVRGEVVGLGHDAEPLLQHVRRVGDWIDHRHLFIPGAERHRLARDEHDEDYEPPEEHPGLHRQAAAEEPEERDYYHVSPYRLPVGTILKPGHHPGNWDESTSTHNHVTPSMDRAEQYHYMLWDKGYPEGHIYHAHPHGPLEPDPDDSEGLRTRHPVEITGYVFGTGSQDDDDEGEGPGWFNPKTRGSREENGFPQCGQCGRHWAASALRSGICPDCHRGHTAASSYDGLTDRSAMIYLDLPEGAVHQVQGGVDDHHITLVYLGKNVSDEAFAEACRRAREAAAQIPPLKGVMHGVDTFPPSDSSDGKVPAFVPAYIPRIGQLRQLLEDLSASEHRHYKPHVTLGYYGPDEDLPAPHPAVKVRFSRLHVKRGDEVVSFPLGHSE
jgi:2'-5' RNA ligase